MREVGPTAVSNAGFQVQEVSTTSEVTAAPNLCRTEPFERSRGQALAVVVCGRPTRHRLAKVIKCCVDVLGVFTLSVAVTTYTAKQE